MNKKGFTLVELLAVITILAIILVIAVPKISSYIVNKKKNLFLTSAKNIVRQLSYENIELETITDSKLNEVGLSGISLSDYDLDKSVVYVVDDDIYIDLVGKGQFDGMYLCGVGMSTEGSVQEEDCDNSNYGKLTLTVELNGGSSSQTFNEKYEKNSEITLENPTKIGTTFTGWQVIKGDAVIEGNVLKLKTKNTTIYALYGDSVRLTVDKNGGSSSQTFNEKYNTGTVIELIDLKRSGHGFTGWEITNGNSVLSGKTLTIGTSDTSIKGIFTECSLGTYNDGSSVTCIPCENRDHVLEWNESPVCSIKTCKGGYELKDNKCVLSDEVWNYPYTGDYQTFTVPRTGYYKLEVWGASGGYTNDNRRGGYGGYSHGEMWLEEGTILYIYVGGSGGLVAGNTWGGSGYNGGGLCSARDGSAGSGGATHISTENGLLNTLSDKITDILIVAGGGGGANYNCTGTSAVGGSGGGYIGGTGKSGAGLGGTGGTQTEPGGANDRVVLPTFGHGADDIKTDNHAVPGGGGGFYGGGSNVNACGGGGGSGYIANQNLINKAMYCYDCEESNEIDTKTISTNSIGEHEKEKANKGNGHSTITWYGTTAP